MFNKVITNQTKTMVLLMLVFTVIILLFSGLVYFSIVNFSHQRFYELLKIRTATIVQIEKSKDHLDLPENYVLSSLNDEELPMEKDYVFAVPTDSNFKKISQEVHIPSYFFKNIIKQGEANYNDKEFYYIGQTFRYDDKDYIAIASAKNHYVVYYLGFLKRTLLTCIVLSLFFSMIFSFYLSKTLFRPILKITGKVKEISSENLHLRLESQPDNKELNELVDTFNDMLNRIETSFETQNHLIGNVSHELRTPLTSIMGEADVALSINRSAEEYKETLEIILDEAEKLDKKIKALLMIAQTGFDGKKLPWEKIRLDELLWSVKTTANQIYPHNKVTLDFNNLPEEADHLSTLGNLPLLQLALSNVVLNACKYSNNQPVAVQLEATKKVLIITVTDQGIGIPSAELGQVFVPFFRASNTGNFEGHGIGLPLTLNIIRLHKGSIDIQAREQSGTIVKIYLPVIA